MKRFIIQSELKHLLNMVISEMITPFCANYIIILVGVKTASKPL